MSDELATREMLAEILQYAKDTNARVIEIQKVMTTIAEQVGPAIDMVQNIPMLKMMIPRGKK
jgi:hypothetical protein